MGACALPVLPTPRLEEEEEEEEVCPSQGLNPIFFCQKRPAVFVQIYPTPVVHPKKGCGGLYPLVKVRSKIGGISPKNFCLRRIEK